MKKITAFILVVFLLSSLSGCSILNDDLLVANKHGYSEGVDQVTSVASGKQTWVGEDCAVIDSSSFSKDKKITSTAALLLNMDEQKAIWGSSIYYKVNPGEAAMLFTIYTALQNSDPEDKITVDDQISNYSVAGCSSLGLKAGDVLSVEQLISSMILRSDVDSANALAIGISGNMDDFVDEMNAQAKSIGCVDTKLKNAAGYYAYSQYTTCYDIYLLMNKLMQNQSFVHIMESTDYDLQYESADGGTCQYQLESDISLLSKNTKISDSLTLSGGIYGSSSSSGHHLVLVSRNSKDECILSILLGADSESSMTKQMKRILKKIKE